jgi:hypothetical protein
MNRYRTKIVVERALHPTFEFISNFGNAAAWDPMVESARKATPGPIGVGTTFVLTSPLPIPFIERQASRLQLDLSYTVEAYEPPEDGHAFVRLEGQTSFMRYVDEIRFSSIDHGTKTEIEYDARIGLKGLFAMGAIAMPLVTRLIGDNATRGMADAVHVNVPERRYTEPARAIEPGAEALPA